MKSINSRVARHKGFEVLNSYVVDLLPVASPFKLIPLPSSTFFLALSFAFIGTFLSTLEGFAKFGMEQLVRIGNRVTINKNVNSFTKF